MSTSKSGRILLSLTKSGKPRFAYLNQLSNQVIASLEPDGRRPQELLFPGLTPEQVTVAFIRACQAANIEDFSLHDLASHVRVAVTNEGSGPAHCRDSCSVTRISA